MTLRFWKRGGNVPDPHADDPLERARGIRFTTRAELDLLCAGEPWHLYKGRSGERILAAVTTARAALERAAVVDRPDAVGAQVLPLAEEAAAAVRHVDAVLGEVRRATARRARLAPEAEVRGEAAATAVAQAAAAGHRVEPLVARLAEASRLLDDAEDVGADPLSATAALERSLAITQQVADDAVGLPFRRQQVEQEVAAAETRILSLRGRLEKTAGHVGALGLRWSPPSLASLVSLTDDVGHLLDLADRHRAGAAGAAAAQEWDAAVEGLAATTHAADDAEQRLEEPARLDAHLTARVAAARSRADGVRTVLRWNRTTRPAWAVALDDLDARLDLALHHLSSPPVDVAAGEAEVATVGAEVERLDRARLAEEQQGAPAGEVWGHGGDQPWAGPPDGPRPPWGRGPWG